MSECRIVAAAALSSAGTTLAECYASVVGSQLCLRPKTRAGISSFFGEVSLNAQLPEDWPANHYSRNNTMLWQLFCQIADEFQALIAEVPAHRIGVVIGTSTSGIAESEPYFQALAAGDGSEKDTLFHLDQQDISSPSVSLATYLGLTGPCLSISTACSSGANALGTAKRWLENDICDLVIAGGVDTLCDLTIQGFDSLGAMSHQRCLPFSSQRAGINLGEGGALFLLTADSKGIQVAGVGSASDAHHFSAPHPEALGAKNAMKMALEQAQLGPADIGYLNLHGTATEQNDTMESKAVRSVFGQVDCSSTKGVMGHTLGAAGAIECALCFSCLELNQLPANTTDVLAEEFADIGLLRETKIKSDLGAVMSNSFAFGGSNVSVVLTKRESN
ncbi:beta-ketoacyl-ACP synthase [Umboniibacter marinipuniceus]|uniref:3-oxoacyl-[acyl-carrier-protein] synthase-1 n=1 Tax=Umboniibacter marinipuniceus TaxID=569599 RepID=A0A3M0AD83_9GAMM|nr:beta-ketoacyl-ACP synthase [Umboniibacter marinipuniceus]RMA82486.1 3-oxoacyl-[acyl-carrier-protein] synthase-1 [Umboniibacter marinipuniceus]